MYISTLIEENAIIVKKNNNKPKVNAHANDARSKIDTKNKRVERRCFNCGNKSHLANECPKPRVECDKCHRLGHDSSKCRRQPVTKKALSCNIKETSTCYSTECFVNGQKTDAFIDTGSSIVAIKECCEKVAIANDNVSTKYTWIWREYCSPCKSDEHKLRG